VERLALFGSRAADLADDVLHAQRLELLAAARALVPARLLVAALVAGAEDVAVGEEHGVLHAVELLARALQEVAVQVEAAEELLARRGVVGAETRAGPVVETDREAVEGALDLLAPAPDVVGVGDVLLLRVDRDRRAVLVRAADEDDVLALHAQRAHVDVGREVGARDLAEVDRAVGVGEGAGDEVAGHVPSVGRVTVPRRDRGFHVGKS
jgi:hypothetical protein